MLDDHGKRDLGGIQRTVGHEQGVVLTERILGCAGLTRGPDPPYLGCPAGAGIHHIEECLLYKCPCFRGKVHLVGLSGLLTSSYDAMRDTVALLREQGYQGPIIAGGRLTEKVCEYVGADYWITDAVTGVELCRRLMSGKIGEELDGLRRQVK